MENILEKNYLDVVSCPVNKRNKYTRITVGRLYCLQIAVIVFCINPLNAELNSICHLLVLLGAHPILHINGIQVNINFLYFKVTPLSSFVTKFLKHIVFPVL
jgi:hypothetical protein